MNIILGQVQRGGSSASEPEALVRVFDDGDIPSSALIRYVSHKHPGLRGPSTSA